MCAHSKKYIITKKLDLKSTKKAPKVNKNTTTNENDKGTLLDDLYYELSGLTHHQKVYKST